MSAVYELSVHLTQGKLHAQAVNLIGRQMTYTKFVDRKSVEVHIGANFYGSSIKSQAAIDPYCVSLLRQLLARRLQSDFLSRLL